VKGDGTVGMRTAYRFVPLYHNDSDVVTVTPHKEASGIILKAKRAVIMAKNAFRSPQQEAEMLEAVSSIANQNRASRNSCNDQLQSSSVATSSTVSVVTW